MTKENDFTLQELELIASQMPLVSKNRGIIQKIEAKIRDMQPKTIRIGEFDVPEPLREVPSDGTPLFVADPTIISLVINWKWESRSGESLLHRGLLHTTIDDAIIHAKALISLTETK